MKRWKETGRPGWARVSSMKGSRSVPMGTEVVGDDKYWRLRLCWRRTELAPEPQDYTTFPGKRTAWTRSHLHLCAVWRDVEPTSQLPGLLLSLCSSCGLHKSFWEEWTVRMVLTRLCYDAVGKSPLYRNSAFTQTFPNSMNENAQGKLTRHQLRCPNNKAENVKSLYSVCVKIYWEAWKWGQDSHDQGIRRQMF